MATTTNFGWETPDDTDLVKDGAAAIRTLGGAIDTSLVDLKGGTTGQVLSKASNTDMDFTWATDASGIPATILDAKGDLIAASAADTAARLAVGTNGQVLTADSTASTGLKWATPATPGLELINTTTFSAVSSQTINNIFSSTYRNYVMYFSVTQSAVTAFLFQMRTGTTNSGSNYRMERFSANNTTLSADRDADTSTCNCFLNGGDSIYGYVTFFNPFEASATGIILEGTAINGVSPHIVKGSGSHTSATSYDGLNIYPGSGTMTGTVRIYGVKN